MPKLIRITTVPISLKLLLQGQMKFMREQGFEVLMVSADGPERSEVVEAEGCIHHVIPLSRTISPIRDLICMYRLVQLFTKEKPDIVHTHTPKAGLLGMLAARICGVKLRIHTVAGLPVMTAEGYKKTLLIWAERLTSWGAHHVWPNSKSLLEYMKTHRFCPESKLDILGKGSSNGIEFKRFSRENLDPKQLQEVQKNIEYNPQLRYLLAIGRIVKDKGINELVKAFLKLSVKYPDVKLLLVGTFEKEREEERLETLVLEAIETHPAIQHISWTDKVACYMALATLFVHPSYREGFPNVLLQAGAMGCPILCSNIAGNVDAVEDQVTGSIFSVQSTEDLYAKLEDALSKPEETRVRAQRMQTFVRENYSREAMHALLLEKYHSLLR